MTSLLELQRDCYRAFVLDDAESVLPHLSNDCIPATARVQVYQNNARETFRKALASSYPVVERLVGDACFRTLTRLYAREHPSRSGDLQNFGARFPQFLDAQYGGSEFDYLGDVAKLEWAIEEVLISPAAEALDPASLSLVAPEELPNIVFRLSPGVRLIGSRYPILDIWRSNQPGSERDVDLAQGAQHVLVGRRGVEAELQTLEPAAFDLARAIERGASLGAACDELAASPGFDLTCAMGALVKHGCLADFSLTHKD